MTLAEAERIIDQVEAGRIDPVPGDVRRVVDDANRRISRDLVWGGEGPARKTTVRVVVAAILFVAAAIAGLLVPLLFAISQE